MPAYNILNSRGVLVSIINVGTTTGDVDTPGNQPIEMIGQGISPYGLFQNESNYHILENFARDTEPVNPAEGMDWYNSLLQQPNFHNGTKFVPYLTTSSAGGGLFAMLPTATGIDFTQATPVTIPIFTAPGDGSSWLPTMLILVPTSTTGPFNPAQFSLEIVADSEDVLENVNLANPDAGTTAHQYNIGGTTRYASGIETISLKIAIEDTTAVDLTVNAFLFGFNNQ